MLNKLKIKAAAAVCILGLFLFGASVPSFAAGVLTIAVSSQSVKAGDTVTVTVYAAGADNADVTADMNVTYDSSKLEYVSSSASNASGGGGSVKASGSSIDIKFKAVGSGDAYVKAEASTMTAAGAHIMVSGSASSDPDSSDPAKSGDNSLSSLTLSAGTLSPAFEGSVTEYSAQVGSDVSEITVTPKTSNAKATVESITGNKDLKEGLNVITVLVKAENGTQASYKINVTKGKTSAAGSAGASDIGADSLTDGENDPADGAQTPVSDGDSIVIDGVSYQISEEFSEDAIPEGFSKADFEYKGKPHKGLVFDSGHLGMYYLVNEAGEGRFFVYDADRDKFYPYVRLSSGEHFIILMVVPNAVIPPDHYEAAQLTIGDVSGISAYQYAGDEDAEIVKDESGSGENISGGTSDFYIFYGMDPSGVSSWYQYDVKQGTYQRFNEEAVGQSDPAEDYESLNKSYQELNDRFKSTKEKDRRLIAVMIFVAVVLVILVINLLLKIREIKNGDDEEEGHKKTAKRPQGTRKKKTYPQKRIKPAKPEKPVSVHSKEDEDFYDGDDEDFIGEFEEDPGVLSRKNRKRERPAKVQKTEPKRPAPAHPELYNKDEDDDLEFLDLNDL